jgi:hypothetical protein
VPASLGDFLKQYAGFSNGNLEDLAEGQPVAKTMETAAGDEVALAGAIRIAVPTDFFLKEFTDIVRFKQGQSVPEVAKFSTPPTLANLAGLHLDKKSLADLQGCQVGNCNLKLSAKDIERFQKDISWSDPKPYILANRLLRQVLLQRVQDYLQSGNAGLADYADKNPPESLSLASGKLLKESTYLSKFAPQLADCLNSFPKCDPKIESFLYWSKEEYGNGLKPVISVTQVLIDRVKMGDSDWIWEASKQIYADHYSDGSLGVTLMVAAPPENGKPSFYLIYLNRTRSDSLKGFFAFFIRGIIRGEARGKLSDQLVRMQTRMQKRWAAASPAGQPSGQVTHSEER